MPRKHKHFYTKFVSHDKETDMATAQCECGSTIDFPSQAKNRTKPIVCKCKNPHCRNGRVREFIDCDDGGGKWSEPFFSECLDCNGTTLALSDERD